VLFGHPFTDYRYRLKVIHFVLNHVLAPQCPASPAKPARYGLETDQELLDESDFDLKSFSFGIRDAFTYAVIVAAKRPAQSRNLD